MATRQGGDEEAQRDFRGGDQGEVTRIRWSEHVYNVEIS